MSESVENNLTINLNGVVGLDISEQMFDYQLAYATDDTVNINITSRGGDYPVAINIYNKLRNSGKKVITCAQGLVASAGAVILLAGDEVTAAGNSVIMFHMPKMMTNEPMGSVELEHKAEMMKTFEKSLIETMKKRMGNDEQMIKDFLEKEQYLTPKEAKKMGLIDRILPFTRKKVDVTNLAETQIVAFAETVNKEVDIMNLKEVCTKLEIQVTDEATEEQIVSILIETVANLRKEVTELQAKIPVEKPKFTLPTTIVNMLKRSREAEVNSLVTSGKIVPAVAKDLLGIFNTDEHIMKSVTDAGEVADYFDVAIDALKKNETVINFSATAGVQSLDKKTAEDNPLVRDAEKRAKGK